jgi:hypothetical protein
MTTNTPVNHSSKKDKTEADVAAAVKAVPPKADYTRIDEAVLNAALTVRQLGLEGTPRERAQRLIMDLAEKVPDGRLVVCSECGFFSDTQDPACTFCGTGDEPKTATTKEASVAADPKTGQKLVKRPKTTKKIKSAPNSAPSIEGEIVDAPAGSGAIVLRDPTMITTTHVNGKSNGKITHANGSDQLDAAVAEVKRLKLETVKSAWQLGIQLKKIFDEKLFLQRRDSKGVPVYKTWPQFCAAELDLTSQHAFKLMDVAAIYSEKQIMQHGIARLGIAIRVPEADRQKFVDDAAKKGLNLKQFKDAASTLTAGQSARDTGRGKGNSNLAKAKAGAKAKQPHKGTAPAAKAQPDARPKITVAMVLGRTKVPLFGRPKKKGAEPVRAKSLKEDPRGSEISPNGVETTYVLQADAKGQLFLVIDRHRST